MENANHQTPATVNQISQEKPSIERTFATLEGTLGGSFNAGHHRTVAWFRLMPGQRVKEYKHNLKIKLLTPLSPAYQPLYCVADSFFVPDKRVYGESEEFVAQNGGTSKIKITKKPTLQGKKIPFITGVQNEEWSLTETTAWRDTFISSYIPRVGYHEPYDRQAAEEWGGLTMPDYDATLLRGKIAIWNDYRRNKQYEPERQEFKGQEVSQVEWESYLPTDADKFRENSMRARRNNSYYMDYRLDAQGFETSLTDALNEQPDNKSLISWASVEAMVAEVRAQSENAEKNTWEVLHELYGTARKLSEGKTQHIGHYVFPLNYASVTQNAYSVGSQTEPKYQVMGQQGAYSYTEIEIPCFAGYEAIEGGWVHVELTVSAATVFERAFERTAMNVKWDDEFRPDLKNQKYDTLNYLEVETAIGRNGLIGGDTQVIGFKRKWSEYFKLPSIVFGDMTTADIEQTEYDDKNNNNIKYSDEQIITQSTHQFYEENALGIGTYQIPGSGEDIIWKKYYMDYSDLLVNKNQAILNEISLVETGQGWEEFIVKGQNQIFYEGTHTLITDLPMPEDIKNNFTKWGEH